MPSVGGSAKTRHIAVKVQAKESVPVTQEGRQIKLSQGVSHFLSAPSRCPNRSFSSYSIEEIMQNLPSVKARRSLPKHIPLSERRDMLQAHRKRGL